MLACWHAGMLACWFHQPSGPTAFYATRVQAVAHQPANTKTVVYCSGPKRHDVVCLRVQLNCCCWLRRPLLPSEMRDLLARTGLPQVHLSDKCPLELWAAPSIDTSTPHHIVTHCCAGRPSRGRYRAVCPDARGDRRIDQHRRRQARAGRVRLARAVCVCGWCIKDKLASLQNCVSPD